MVCRRRPGQVGGSPSWAPSISLSAQPALAQCMQLNSTAVHCAATLRPSGIACGRVQSAAVQILPPSLSGPCCVRLLPPLVALLVIHSGMAC